VLIKALDGEPILKTACLDSVSALYRAWYEAGLETLKTTANRWLFVCLAWGVAHKL
jgi:hypothetical protein